MKKTRTQLDRFELDKKNTASGYKEIKINLKQNHSVVAKNGIVKIELQKMYINWF